jgi:hypothetical protein
VLVTVILLMLVLTVLGLSAVIMMTQEDRSSNNAELQKEALYVAEAGLRRGEWILTNDVTYSNPTLESIFLHTSTEYCPALGNVVPQPPSPWDMNHLGTYLMSDGIGASGATQLANIEVTSTYHGDRRSFYSLLVRNNEDDGATPATRNNDTKIRLISVGWIADQAGQPLAVKIIEEEYAFWGAANNPSAQKQVDQGGTGSGMYGGA